ncbi:MAG: hypothetical protein GY822_03155 [Deltaproteobacteria bacterium]|nr:hypothetical protein [Deltaproteobacteria bacterium]
MPTTEITASVLEHYGDFHDAIILKISSDYSAKPLEIQLDNINAGLHDVLPVPCRIIALDVELQHICIPFIGGVLRIEDLELSKSNHRSKLTFGLATTEWLDTDIFENIELVVESPNITVSWHQPPK